MLKIFQHCGTLPTGPPGCLESRRRRNKRVAKVLLICPPYQLVWFDSAALGKRQQEAQRGVSTFKSPLTWSITHSVSPRSICSPFFTLTFWWLNSAASTTTKRVLSTAAVNVICLLPLKEILRGRGALQSLLHPRHTQRALGGGRGEEGASGSSSLPP